MRRVATRIVRQSIPLTDRGRRGPRRALFLEVHCMDTRRGLRWGDETRERRERVRMIEDLYSMIGLVLSFSMN